MQIETKCNETEQKVAKRTLRYATKRDETKTKSDKTKTESDEMEQKVVKRTSIYANFNK